VDKAVNSTKHQGPDCIVKKEIKEEKPVKTLLHYFPLKRKSPSS
jgi:hypothetical protein